MSRRCTFCNKKSQSGASVARRGLPKKKGGIGLKITGVTKRKFFPNLQKKRVVIGGKIKSVYVCTRCIKKGNLPIPARPSGAGGSSRTVREGRKPTVSNN